MPCENCKELEGKLKGLREALEQAEEALLVDMAQPHSSHAAEWTPPTDAVVKAWNILERADIATSTPVGEEPQFNEAGFSKHGCHYGTMYTRIGDEVYDSEDCKECDDAREPRPSETQTVRPCVEPEPFCAICHGSGTLTIPRGDEQ